MERVKKEEQGNMIDNEFSYIIWFYRYEAAKTKEYYGAHMVFKPRWLSFTFSILSCDFFSHTLIRWLCSRETTKEGGLIPVQSCAV